MTLFQDNISTYLSFVEGSAPSSPAATNFRIYYDSADHLLKWKNSAGTVAVVNSASTPWTSGTSMPGSPATNQRITRTDLGRDFFYDGTRWRSVDTFRETMIPPQAMPCTTDSTAIGRMPLWDTSLDLYVLTFHVATLVQTTNNGTNFWQIQLRKIDGSATATTLVTARTSADSIATWVNHNQTVNAVVAAATYKLFDANTVKTLSPGNLFWALSVSYQIIGT